MFKDFLRNFIGGFVFAQFVISYISSYNTLDLTPFVLSNKSGSSKLKVKISTLNHFMDIFVPHLWSSLARGLCTSFGSPHAAPMGHLMHHIWVIMYHIWVI